MEEERSMFALNGTIPAVLEQLDVITDEIKCLRSQENVSQTFTGNSFNLVFLLITYK